VAQLSVNQDFDPVEHLQAGAALALLREEGVLTIGSGLSFHNLRLSGFAGVEPAATLDAWLREAMTAGRASAPTSDFASPTDLRVGREPLRNAQT